MLQFACDVLNAFQIKRGIFMGEEDKKIETEMQALARRMKQLKAQRDAKTVTGKFTYAPSGDEEGLFIGDLDDSNIKTDIEGVNVREKVRYNVVGKDFWMLRKKDGTQAEFVEEGEEYNAN